MPRSQHLRILTSDIANSDTIVLFINQLRDKIGQFFGAKTTTPGGRALKFYSSVRLEVVKTKSLKKNDQIVGNEILIKVMKNKVAPPFKNCKIELNYEKGINRELDMIITAIEHDLVTRSGSTYSMTSPKAGEEPIKLGVGIDHACKELRDNVKVADSLRKSIMEKLKENSSRSSEVTPEKDEN